MRFQRHSILSEKLCLFAFWRNFCEKNSKKIWGFDAIISFISQKSDMIRPIIPYAISVIVFASLATPPGGQVAESPAFDAQEYLFTSIDFVDSLSLWRAGETVLRTIDGGHSWRPPDDSSGVFYYGIDFIDLVDVFKKPGDHRVSWHIFLNNHRR